MEKKEVEQNDELSVYEVGYLVLPSLPEDKVPEVATVVREVFVKEGGMEISAEEPVKRDLAYSMSKTIGASRYVLTDAYFGWIKFEVGPSKIEAINLKLRKIPEILRFLLIKAPRETVFTMAGARAEALEKEKVSSSPSEGEVLN